MCYLSLNIFGRHTPRFLAATAIASSMLLGCGGGGDSANNNENVPPPSTVAPEPTTLALLPLPSVVDVDERDTILVPFEVDYNGADSLIFELSVEGNINLLKAEVDGENIIVRAPDTQSINQSASVTLTVTAGDISDARSFTVKIRNTSFWQSQSALLNLADDAKAYSASNMSSTNLVIFALDVDRKLDYLTRDNFDIQAVEAAATITSQLNALTSSANDALAQLNAFTDSSTADENDLVAIQNILDSAFAQYASTVSNLYNNAVSVDNVVLPQLTIDTLYPTQTGLSLFVGNPTLGVVSSDTWTFNDNVAFLEPLTQTTLCIEL